MLCILQLKLNVAILKGELVMQKLFLLNVLILTSSLIYSQMPEVHHGSRFALKCQPNWQLNIKYANHQNPHSCIASCRTKAKSSLRRASANNLIHKPKLIDVTTGTQVLFGETAMKEFLKTAGSITVKKINSGLAISCDRTHRIDIAPEGHISCKTVTRATQNSVIPKGV